MIYNIEPGCQMPKDRQEIEVFDVILGKFRFAYYKEDKTSSIHTGWFKVYGLDSEVPTHSGRFTQWKNLKED